MNVLGVDQDWMLEEDAHHFELDDYVGAVARWCPACGDHAVLSAVQRICRDEQLPPEKVVAVSGIGCSSRFPHYMKTYGFHGLHGRALPVACGIKARRPDLTIWVATGDGDCCSIGAGHWIHAVRYNMDMTVMLFDNWVYGLTKNQTSPTSPTGYKSNTHPRGAWLPPLNPIAAVLGFTNASFVAQTVDWVAPHLYETLKAAHKHKGLSFVRILQRCPTYTQHVFENIQNDPSRVLLLKHEQGIPVSKAVERMLPNHAQHDPSDIHKGREFAEDSEKLPVGLLFRDESRPTYDSFTVQGLDMSYEERLANLQQELDRLSV